VLIADTRNGRIRRVERDGVIRVVAGTTLPWDAGEGRWDKGDYGPALSASFSYIEAVTVGPHDDIYIGDAVGRVRKIDAQTGIITTVAGLGISGYTGDGGPAIQARIGAPAAIRFDRQGNLYVADRAFHVIRRVGVDGVITTVAGCGQVGFSPDGTPAQAARLDMPSGLAVAPDGAIYFSDSRNNRVRRITPDGRLETVAGDGVAGDDGDGGPATHAHLNEPRGLCFWGDGIVLISDHYNNRIRAIRV
jgi:serine/threonine-protein kinase